MIDRAPTTALVCVGVVTALSVFGCIPPRSNQPAVWNLADAPARRVGCGDFEAWVVKSGRQGVGVTVRLNSLEAACAMRVQRASIVIFGDAEHPAARLPAPVVVGAGKPIHLYLPFLFDNLGAWRRGSRDGELVLTVTATPVGRVGNNAVESVTALRLPMQIRRDTALWTVDYRAFMDRHPRDLIEMTADGPVWTRLRWSCVAVDWVGADGDDHVFQGMLELSTNAPDCRFSVRAAELVWGPDTVRATVDPRPYALTPEHGSSLRLNFQVRADLHPTVARLDIELENAYGVSVPLEWPLYLPGSLTRPSPEQAGMDDKNGEDGGSTSAP